MRGRCEFFAATDATSDLRLQIFPERFRHNARRSEFAQVGNRELRKISEHAGEGRQGVTDQREAHVIRLRPFAVPRNGVGPHLSDWSVPIKWNPLIDRTQLRFKELEYDLIQKAGQLFG